MKIRKRDAALRLEQIAARIEDLECEIDCCEHDGTPVHPDDAAELAELYTEQRVLQEVLL